MSAGWFYTPIISSAPSVGANQREYLSLKMAVGHGDSAPRWSDLAKSMAGPCHTPRRLAACVALLFLALAAMPPSKMVAYWYQRMPGRPGTYPQAAGATQITCHVPGLSIRTFTRLKFIRSRLTWLPPLPVVGSSCHPTAGRPGRTSTGTAIAAPLGWTQLILTI